MNSVSLKNKNVAIIVGTGDLPIQVIRGAKELGVKFCLVRFSEVVSTSFKGEDIIEATFERISDLFYELKDRNFNSIVCCGYMPRPKLNFSKIDLESRLILQPLLRKFHIGDEAIFFSLLELFKDRNLIPLRIADFVPNLFPINEFLTKRKPSDSDVSDAERSEKILKVMSTADIGQGLVVTRGICLAIETSPGTDSMLNFVQTYKRNNSLAPSGGVLYKAPKYGQNKFIDQPVIGLETVKGVKKAELNGIVIKHSQVICIDLMKIIKLADDLNIFIWSKS